MTAKITTYPEIPDGQGKISCIYVTIDNGARLMVHSFKNHQDVLGFIDALRDVADKAFGKKDV